MSKEEQRKAIRSAMPTDMLQFCDEMREVFGDVKMEFLQTETLTLGKEGERGIAPYVPIKNIDVEKRSNVKQSKDTNNRG